MMSSRLWITEKPDQARRLAEVLGIQGRDKHSMQTRAGVVTWAYGHLLELADPDAYDPALKQWTLEPLPFMPDSFKRTPKREAYAASQLREIVKLLKGGITEVIIATDADREGELIGREILEYARYRGAVKRLWLSALDQASIKKAIGALREGRETVGLAVAANARSIADWTVGLNLTRIVSLRVPRERRSGPISVGRVQTPTLALVVRRDRAIETFTPQDYYELVADVATSAGSLRMRYAPSDDHRILDPLTAQRLVHAVKERQGPLRVRHEIATHRPPKPFALSTLQAAADKAFGWPASKTLQVAQELYERATLTYPRTDCEYLPEAQVSEVPSVLAALRGNPVVADVAKRVREPVIHRWLWDNSKVTAHHAIIPTAEPATGLTEDQTALYLLVARRYLQALSPDSIDDVTKAELVLAVDGWHEPVAFRAKHVQTKQPGWKALSSREEHEDAQDGEDNQNAEWPAVVDGMLAVVRKPAIDTRTTTPPAHYTEGTLIADMRSIAKFVANPELKQTLKEGDGIGTEATRAETLKVLKERGYITRKGRTIRSTAIGRALIDDLVPELVEPDLTALWEQRMKRLEQGDEKIEDFVDSIRAFVRRVAAEMKAKPLTHLTAASAEQPTVPSNPRSSERGKGKPANSPPSHRKYRPRAASGPGAPTDKMRALARDLADKRGERLPPDVLNDFEACRAYIDARVERPAVPEGGTRLPTPKQLEFAEKLAKRRGWVVPVEARSSFAECSKFIEMAQKQ
jgi:DNA topoisomerase-3